MSDATPSYVLGLSCYYHDAAAVLLRDGDIVAAAQEERFTRKKFDSSFPQNAIRYCLREANISPEMLTATAFYEDPVVKLDRVLNTRLPAKPLEIVRNVKSISGWLDDKFPVERDIYGFMPSFNGPVIFSHHHLSHAASAFFPSPFADAAVVVIDGVGEWSTISIGRGSGNKVEILAEQHYPHSLGLLYSAFTQYLGFKVDSGEYKVMGLAPYGEPVFSNAIYEHLISIGEQGDIELDLSYFDYVAGTRMINARFESLFGAPARRPDEPLTQTHMDIARSIQVVLEDAVQKIVRYAVDETGCRNVVMSGGVALNCVSNGRLVRDSIVDRLWVQPAAGDAGSALGAALIVHHHVNGAPRPAPEGDRQGGSFLGPSFDDEQIRDVIEAYGFVANHYSQDELPEKVAALAADGDVIGVFQSRMEFGPRALGARSIIADPRGADIQRRLNLKIKFRESFRPFAPMVLRERMADWFDYADESPYMLITAPVKEDRRRPVSEQQATARGLEKLKVVRSDIPGVTHVDHSARIQTIDAERNPFMHLVMSKFDDLTGCPVLINTSFNVRGEPIVASPYDALRCFMNTHMDRLVLGSYVLSKDDQSGQLVEADFASSFAPD